MSEGPLIVQSDKTLLLDIDHPLSTECRRAIAPFAELERSPEHIHTYRLTNLGLWNARAAGHDAELVIDTLIKYSRYAVPHSLLVDVAETMSRYGRLRLEADPVHGLILITTDVGVLEEVIRAKKIAPLLGVRIDSETIAVHPSQRGAIKQSLLRLGWPAEDFAGYVDGQAHEIALKQNDWKIRPVTIATYQVMTKKKNGVYAHLDLFDTHDWGLIIYDEVHLLPAPIFRFTADIQSRRRLGLTATLVREDGMEGEVFSLIGPKRFDVPWKEIEAQGYIAPAECIEVRVNLTEAERLSYATAEPEERYRYCATTRTKRNVVEELVALHAGEQILVIGQYIDQLDDLSETLGVPVIKGETPIKERERLFAAFRTGEITCLVVSKVANFSIDLPEATIAIQVSGAFGSRQEEAQRLGRIVRPKADGRGAKFYSVVSRDTIDQDFAQNRQRFLAEQGYSYRIIDADDVFQGKI